MSKWQRAVEGKRQKWAEEKKSDVKNVIATDTGMKKSKRKVRKKLCYAISSKTRTSTK